MEKLIVYRSFHRKMLNEKNIWQMEKIIRNSIAANNYENEIESI